MTILSLQAIIQKYGANFGIDPKAALKAPANDAAAGASKNASTNASAQAPQTKDAATQKIPPADTLNLSPAAKDFLAAHTGPLGQFEMPNMMDEFFGALDGTDASGSGTGNSLVDYLSGSDNADASGSGTGNSLLDYLSGSNNANPADGGSGASLFDFQNPFGTGGSPSQSLDSFL